MKYLFLDIECSNGSDICSIGYVVADNKFNVIEQRDVLINPESRFVLTNKAGTQGIRLAYDQEAFYSAPTFPHYYKEIKQLLENEETTVVGFAVSNDAGFIKKACNRYSLKQINFEFFDVQRLDARLHCDGNIRSLQKIIDYYGIVQDEENILHKSDDDAFFTMEVLRKILAETGKTFEEIMSENHWCIGKSYCGEISYDGHNVINVDKMRRRDVIVFRKYCEQLEAQNACTEGILSGKKINFDRAYESKNYRKMLVLAEKLYALGGEMAQITKCNIFVCNGKENSIVKKMRAKNVEVINVEDFVRMLGMTVSELEVQAEKVDINAFKSRADECAYHGDF